MLYIIPKPHTLFKFEHFTSLSALYHISILVLSAAQSNTVATETVILSVDVTSTRVQVAPVSSRASSARPPVATRRTCEEVAIGTAVVVSTQELERPFINTVVIGAIPLMYIITLVKNQILRYNTSKHGGLFTIMKKLIISGSSKLYERAIYWRGYFEGRGYEVIDWPAPVFENNPDTNEDVTEDGPVPGFYPGQPLTSNDRAYAKSLLGTYKRFWRNLDRADVLFVMNENRHNITGYVGAGTYAELQHVITNNLNHHHQTEIYLLQMPDKSQGCFEEIGFWLEQNLIKIYRPPKTTPTVCDHIIEEEPATPTVEKPELPTPVASVKSSLFSRSSEKSINLATCKDRALRPLTPSLREYLKIFSPTFPAWLLKYIAAPEFQRLKDVSMTTMDYSAIDNFQNFGSVFTHSIGVALIIWNFTHDKVQTLAGLFHDIASPSFKHAVDYLNGDSEHQESIESRTGEIIRNSRVITRQLKRDGILPGEISDYKLFPIADNDVPGLAADRLEYTFSNGYFLFDTWNLSDVKRFYDNITILRNEAGLDELGFKDAKLTAEFTTRNLLLCEKYHRPAARASLQFIADILSSMIAKDRLSLDDLYTMTEREVIDWILSCGDHALAEAFRNFQRTTSAYGSDKAKKDTYTTEVIAKVRYIDPLVKTTEQDVDGNPISRRISELDADTKSEIESYLATKQPRFVGFDFNFTPESPKSDKTPKSDKN